MKTARNIKNSPLLPIFFTILLDLIGVGIIIPILPALLITPELSILPLDTPFSTRVFLFGLLGSTFSIAQFFGAPILGTLSDRMGRKKLLLASLIGTFLGYLLFIFSLMTGQILLMFAARLIKGFFGGNISIAMSAIADVSKPQDKAKNFGLIGMAFGIGFIIGPFIGGKLSDPSIVSWFSMTTPFIFAACLSVVNIILLAFRFKETLTTYSHRPITFLTGIINIRRAFGIKELRTLFIVMFLVMFGSTFFMNTFQVYLTEKFKYNPSQIADMFAYMGLWIAMTQGIITRVVSHRFAPKSIIQITLLVSCLSFLAIGFQSNPLGLYLILPFFAVANGLTNPNSMAIISNLSPKETQGEILGINQSLQSLAMAITPFVSSLFLAVNVSLPLYIASFVLLLAWIYFIIFFKTHKV